MSTEVLAPIYFPTGIIDPDEARPLPFDNGKRARSTTVAAIERAQQHLMLMRKVSSGGMCRPHQVAHNTVLAFPFPVWREPYSERCLVSVRATFIAGIASYGLGRVKVTSTVDTTGTELDIPINPLTKTPNASDASVLVFDVGLGAGDGTDLGVEVLTITVSNDVVSTGPIVYFWGVSAQPWNDRKVTIT